MDDNQIRETIDQLVAEEHELREQHQFDPLSGERAERLRRLEESLDQCWDLLRQRRAKRVRHAPSVSGELRERKDLLSRPPGASVLRDWRPAARWTSTSLSQRHAPTFLPQIGHEA